jgi:hypothetical protein
MAALGFFANARMPSSNSVKLARRFCVENLECPWLRKCRDSGDPLHRFLAPHYEGEKLVCVARTRNGFTPALRQELFQRFPRLETAKCTFANLPEARSGRPLGSRPHDEEDGKLPLLATRVRRAFKVHRMDARRSFAALAVCRAARG